MKFSYMILLSLISSSCAEDTSVDTRTGKAEAIANDVTSGQKSATADHAPVDTKSASIEVPSDFASQQSGDSSAVVQAVSATSATPAQSVASGSTSAAAGAPAPQFAASSASAPSGMAGEFGIVADNSYVVRLNGQQIGSGNNWQQYFRHSVSFGAGRNVMEFDVSNSGGPGALIVDVRFGVERLHSDETWEVRADQYAAWVPATVHANLGSGPWGNYVSGVPEASMGKWIGLSDISAPFFQARKIIMIGN